MKILIVGSRGFIGSHCVDYFEKNNEVWGCDVVLDYASNHYFSIDAVDSDFQNIFQQQKFDVCINCSGAANVPFSLERPINDFKLNTLNVFKLLEAIRLYAPGCKFINMSSAAVYGNPLSLPIKESDKRNPVSPYGLHKLMAEIVCEEFYHFWGMKTCSLRIFSAYGPRLKKQLFWDMYNKVKNQSELVLWGTGRESRDFIYVKDVIRVINLIINRGSFDGSVYNTANGMQNSIAEVAEIFVNVLGTNTKISFNNEERRGDPLNWEADISRIKALGYAPEYTLKRGIEEYVLWIKSLKD